MAHKYLSQGSVNSPKTRWVDKVININPAAQDYLGPFIAVFVAINVFVMFFHDYRFFAVPAYIAAVSIFSRIAFYIEKTGSIYEDNAKGVRLLMYIAGISMTVLFALTFIAQFISDDAAAILAALTVLNLLICAVGCGFAYPDLAQNSREVNGYMQNSSKKGHVDFYDSSSPYYDPLYQSRHR